MNIEERAEARLLDSRARFERQICDLRTSIDREVGWAPRLRTWALPLIGLGAGLILGRGVVKTIRGPRC